ncbi:MAG TPA: hypothetical protein VFZ93_05575 [Albitalea sp.]
MTAWLPTRPARTARRALFDAWLVATVFSGAPSTVHALLVGADPLEATLAAGRMLLPHETAALPLVAAAAVVHPAVSAFWAVVFARLLPARHTVAWSVAGALAVGLLDLRVIAPALFPDVAALPFGPQMADHAMWGALLGLAWRWRRPPARALPALQHPNS